MNGSNARYSSGDMPMTKPSGIATSAAQPKPQYDNLEQEMASLLGRPGKT